MPTNTITHRIRVTLHLAKTVSIVKATVDSYIRCTDATLQIVIGTKSGQLELYDLGSSALLETIDAHAGAIWALAARPEGQTGNTQQICTGSADHDVKFWDVELKLDPDWSATQKRLTLECVRTLTMTDDVLAVKYSPDAKLLAVSLLDATVKVFYEDSLKFFLSLCVSRHAIASWSAWHTQAGRTKRLEQLRSYDDNFLHVLSEWRLESLMRALEQRSRAHADYNLLPELFNPSRHHLSHLDMY